MSKCAIPCRVCRKCVKVVIGEGYYLDELNETRHNIPFIREEAKIKDRNNFCSKDCIRVFHLALKMQQPPHLEPGTVCESNLCRNILPDNMEALWYVNKIYCPGDMNFYTHYNWFNWPPQRPIDTHFFCSKECARSWCACKNEVESMFFR